MTDEPDDPREPKPSLPVEVAAELVGGSAGAVISAVAAAAGVVGALPVVGGLALSVLAKRLTTEVAQWALARGQRHRVDEALSWGTAEVQRLIGAGLVVRPEVQAGCGPDADRAFEVMEGSLLLARDAHEARKARHFGTFWARFAFMPDVSAAEANYLMEMARRLTFRQWLVIEVVARGVRVVREVPDADATAGRTSAWASADAELVELGGLLPGLPHVDEPQRPRNPPLAPTVATMRRLLGLEAIDAGELAEAVAVLASSQFIAK